MSQAAPEPGISLAFSYAGPQASRLRKFFPTDGSETNGDPKSKKGACLRGELSQIC